MSLDNKSGHRNAETERDLLRTRVRELEHGLKIISENSQASFKMAHVS